MSHEPPSLISERQETHGDFRDTAIIAQRLKMIVRGRMPKYPDEDAGYVINESLEMICVKMARILSGDCNHRDHWDDIIGYAQLAAAVCTK